MTITDQVCGSSQQHDSRTQALRESLRALAEIVSIPLAGTARIGHTEDIIESAIERLAPLAAGDSAIAEVHEYLSCVHGEVRFIKALGLPPDRVEVRNVEWDLAVADHVSRFRKR